MLRTAALGHKQPLTILAAERLLTAKSSLSRRLSKDALAATYPAVLRGANRFVVAPICLAAQEPHAGLDEQAAELFDRATAVVDRSSGRRHRALVGDVVLTVGVDITAGGFS